MEVQIANFIEYSIQDSTEFIVNAPYTAVLSWLSRSSIGLSTMVDEHFGINVVEYMVSTRSNLFFCQPSAKATFRLLD